MTIDPNSVNLTTLLASVITGIFGILAVVIPVWVNKKINDQSAALAINNAVKNSLGALQQAAQGEAVLLNPQVHIPNVAAPLVPAVQYVLDHVGTEMQRLGITPEAVASKVSAQIGLSAIEHNLALTASPAAEAPPPLAPVESTQKQVIGV